MFAELMARVARDRGLEYRDEAILVTSTAPAIGNSACSLAWGNRLAKSVDVETAVHALHGGHSESMTERDRVLAKWARNVATDPTATTATDVADLRRSGLSNAEIFNVTLYAALRIAFSTLNDALDAPLDRRATEGFPAEVLEAVDFGRPLA
jgi:alkylhydroperoxidase family enzyme